MPPKIPALDFIRHWATFSKAFLAQRMFKPASSGQSGNHFSFLPFWWSIVRVWHFHLHCHGPLYSIIVFIGQMDQILAKSSGHLFKSPFWMMLSTLVGETTPTNLTPAHYAGGPEEIHILKNFPKHQLWWQKEEILGYLQRKQRDV